MEELSDRRDSCQTSGKTERGLVLDKVVNLGRENVICAREEDLKERVTERR